MNVKMYLKVFGFGLLLFLITMILLFVMSIATGSDQPVDSWWVGIVIAILVAVGSWLFARRLHPATAKWAITLGIVWAVMIAAILLIIAIPNKTTGIVFGQWSTYLIFIGVVVGPLFVKQKPISSDNTQPLK